MSELEILQQFRHAMAGSLKAVRAKADKIRWGESTEMSRTADFRNECVAHANRTEVALQQLGEQMAQLHEVQP